MKRAILFLMIFGFLTQLHAHTVQIAWQTLANGKVRVWLEHWHGHVHGTPSNFYITASVTYGGVTTNQTYYADGFYNDTPMANLPESSNIIVLSGCAGKANTYNDWIYFDFNPPACNQSVSITILNGPPVETTEGCPEIFPQTVGSNFDDLAGPIITASDTCMAVQGNNTISNFTNLSIEDACDAAPTVVYKVNGNVITLPYDFPLGTTSVTVEATDNANNASSTSFDVQVMSGINLTHNQDVSCIDGNEGSLSAPGGFSSYSWTGPNGYSNATQNASNLEAGNYTVTVQNTAGCTFQASEEILVLDSLAPIITDLNNTIYLDASGAASIVATDVASIIDNCSVASFNVVPNSFSCADTGQVMLYVTAVDNNGLTASDTVYMNLKDTVSPQINPVNIEVYLDTAGNANLDINSLVFNIYDNCEVDTMFIATDSYDCSAYGIQTNYITVIDVAGNSSTSSFLVEVKDTIGVEIIFNTIVNFESACYVTSLSNPVITDNCSDNATVSNNAVFPIERDTIVEWYLSDGHGNDDTLYQSIVINDTIMPVLNCPFSLNRYADASCSIPLGNLNAEIVATDNCSLISLSQSVDSNYLLSVGDTLNVVYTIVDFGNNSESCNIQVFGLDTIVPNIICPQDITEYATSENCSFMIGDYTSLAQVEENCIALSVAQNPVENTSLTGNDNIITLSVSDASGNSTSCIFNIEVIDTLVPVLDMEQFDSTVITCSLRELDAPTFKDNCGSQFSVTNDIADFGAIGPDTLEVTWTATDQQGNATQVVQTVYLDSHLPGFIYQLSDTLFAGNQDMQYEWIDCNSGQTLQLGDLGYYITNEAGSYAVYEISENGCRTKSDCYNIFEDEAAGLTSLSQAGISIYPNPVHNDLFIGDDLKQIEMIKIYDHLGKLVVEIEKGNINTYQVNLSSLESGSYILSIQTNDQQFKHQFIKN